MRSLCLIALLLALCPVAFLRAANGDPPAGEPVVYKVASDRELHLHVIKPPGWQASDRRPAIVFYHGGGWIGGTPAQFNEQARYFASRGLVCFLAEYRLLAPKSDTPPLACIQDARSAFRWVRSHAAELGLDPGRIAAGGGSAGGHLAAHLGFIEGLDDPADDRSVSARPDALLLFNPVLDNGPGGFGAGRIGERYREFSPAHNVTAAAPPTILFVGSADSLVPVATLESVRDRLRAAGVRSELHVYAGQPHGFFNYKREEDAYYRRTVLAADRFLAGLGWLDHAPTLTEPAADVP